MDDKQKLQLSNMIKANNVEESNRTNKKVKT
jgi:hypothetical protein